MHQRGDVADRADVDLRTRQEGDGAVEVDGEATLDLVEDDAFDALIGFELSFQTDPAFLAAGFLARQNSFAKRVLDALDIDFDLVAGLHRAVFRLGAEFLQRHAALDLEADIDDGDVLFDAGDDALGDITFGKILAGK